MCVPQRPMDIRQREGKYRADMSPKNYAIFSQGEAADAVFYIQAGTVKLTVLSPQGKEAVVAILERGAFLGESCLAGHSAHAASATTLEDSTLVRLDKDAMIHALHEESPVLRTVYVLSAGSHDARSRECGGSTLQFQRKAACAGLAVDGPF